MTDPAVPPSPEVLQSALGASYPVYEKMLAVITGDPYGLVPEWRYYNDGKAWLCKVVFKKKTVFWLSVWDGSFKTGFYFAERHIRGTLELEIDDSIKEKLKKTEPSGKLYPVVIVIDTEQQLSDLLKIIEFKKGLK